MSECLTRRAFVRLGVCIGATASLSRLRAPLVLRLGFVRSSGAASHDQQLGVELGVDEARHAAQLFGGSIDVVSIATPSAGDRQLSAIVGGGDEAACELWTSHAVDLTTIYLNIGCASDALRGDRCSRAAFHVVPSEAMYRDALARTEVHGGAATAWDASLTRFGADTLNQRFRARFNRPMTSEAWCGWIAVKILWESALRQHSGEGAAIAEYLTRDATQFDGHKGQPLSFRAWDHQLRQPLYVAPTSGQRMLEVPEPTDHSLRDALDQLGTSQSATTCRMSS